MKVPNTFLRSCLLSSMLAAKEAGEAILDVYKDDIDVEYKSDKSPLTVADRRAHSIILNQLSRGTPRRIPVLSEEGKDTSHDERKMWEYFWLVDPLDGTKEFISRRGEFTVNIALVYKRRPVLGIVLVPAQSLLYFALEGLGSYRLDNLEIVGQIFSRLGSQKNESLALEDILTSAEKLPIYQDVDRPDQCLKLVGSRSHATHAMEEFIRRAEQRYGKVEFVPAGSALKFGLVAEGNADIYPRLGPTMEWDTAAGQCVVEQSGGTVLDLMERVPLDYNRKDLLNPYFICLGVLSKDFQW